MDALFKCSLIIAPLSAREDLHRQSQTSIDWRQRLATGDICLLAQISIGAKTDVVNIITIKKASHSNHILLEQSSYSFTLSNISY